MIEQMETAIKGVICLHCGMDTPLPRSANPRRSADGFLAPRPKIALVRCTSCGKEAPYLTEEIVVHERLSVMAMHAA